MLLTFSTTLFLVTNKVFLILLIIQNILLYFQPFSLLHFQVKKFITNCINISFSLGLDSAIKRVRLARVLLSMIGLSLTYKIL